VGSNLRGRNLSINKRVSFRALRILTYTILFKAIIDAVILISGLTGSDLIYTIARFAGFINLVACVLCFVGVTALSSRFITAHRITVAVLILECVALLMVTVELRLMVINYEAAAAVGEYITLFLIAAGRLLIGAAFFLLMTGFGKILREEEQIASALSSERMGIIYLCCSSIGAILRLFALSSDSTIITAVSAAFDIAGIILDILVYRRATDSAFLIWKKRGTAITKGWV